MDWQLTDAVVAEAIVLDGLQVMELFATVTTTLLLVVQAPMHVVVSNTICPLEHIMV